MSEQGNAFRMNYDDGAKERTKMVSFAILDAKSTLPKGTVFEVRTKETPKEHRSDYGRDFTSRDEAAKDWGVAWYRNDGTPEGPLFHTDVDTAFTPPGGGYLLVARLRTPE
jgi:hypothetical protein